MNRQNENGPSGPHSDLSIPSYEAFFFDVDPKELEDPLYRSHSNEPHYEKFTFELSHVNEFPPGDEDDDYDPESGQKELNEFLNQWYPMTESPPIILLKRFIFFLRKLKSLVFHNPFDDLKGNEDKVSNLGILVVNGHSDVELIPEKNLKIKTLSEEILILEQSEFSPPYSDLELLFYLELSMIETVLPFSSENEDNVFRFPLIEKTSMIDVVAFHHCHSIFDRSSCLCQGSPQF
ncbi:hypothetical protein Tco_0648782 [Tanacetum coccineum]